MTQTFRELIIGGVLVAPIISYVLMAVAIIMVLRPVLHFMRFPSFFSNPPIAELSLYVAIVGLLVLTV
ncbi:DUF1656 domain-containing protein [Bradyrhizobium sp. C-145]|uniref:DUF1656 domain-containing protein n=1 Tax=Bradyrhizobium sp. C-145 TaxID=574727 RepID=UPI00201B76CA|nr:DUF1656 domain-containing protein [Bradyrhizobium sp. C-145]UQR63194.1 DUF1656 domain-containing protein [Bradyrhizobium sp. C-145]